MAKKRHHTKLSTDALELVAGRFRVLGDPTRLTLLQRLMDGEKNVTDLVHLTGTTQANISKHLSTLLQHGMVYKRREGLSMYYGIADPSIFKLCDIVCGGLQKHHEHRARTISS